MDQTKPDLQKGVCSERVHYMEDFLQAIRELGTLQSEQAKAVIESDPEFSRFDLLIHMANERKDRAKYALLLHVQEHGC
jgi:hypothetical protein